MVFTLVDCMRLFSESFTHFYISFVVDTSGEIYFSRFVVSPHCLVETTAGGSGLIHYSMDVEATTATLLSRCPLNSNRLGGGFAPRHLSRLLPLDFSQQYDKIAVIA